MTRRRWGRTVLKSLLLLAVLLFAADLTLRFALGLGTPILYRVDPAAGYVVAPSQDIRRFGCLNRINRFSMRSPEVISPKPPREFRLLMIGDSFTYGTTYVDQPLIFTSLLDHDLPTRLGRPVEVLNASAGGWAPANELGYLRTRGTFDADVVCFVLNTGDLTQPFSGFALGGTDAFPIQDPACALSELWNRYLFPRIWHGVTHDPGSVAEVPNIAHDTPTNLQTLEQAKLLATDHGAAFKILYIPSQGPEWVIYAPGYQLLKSWCAEQHVELVDVTPAFAKVPAQQIAFDNGHGHLRPLGHAIVAQTFADALVAAARVTTAPAATRPF